MKQILKRTTALFLAVLLSMSVCVQSVSALDGEDETEAVSQADTVREADTALPAEEAPAEPDEVLPAEEAPAEPDEVPAAEPDSELPLEAAADSERSEAAEAELAYVVVLEPELASGDTQHILVGFADESLMVDSAVLTIRNERTGATVEYAASELVEGAALFSFSADEAGACQVIALSYVMDGERFAVDCGAVGVDARFGVDAEVVTDPDDVLVEKGTGDEPMPQIAVSAIGEDGTVEWTRPIGEAMSELSEATVASAVGDSVDATSARTKVVVLDPGHDNRHGGATSTIGGVTYREEELTLKIALYAKAELEKYSGVKVYMTRTTEDCPFYNVAGEDGTVSKGAAADNYNRVLFAASVNADYYVAIHLNSAVVSGASGVEIYYPNSNFAGDENPAVDDGGNVSTDGKALAAAIIQKLIALGLKNRGLQVRNSADGTKYSDGTLADYYSIIKNSKKHGFPAIIVEHCFLSNAGDVANYLSSDAKLKALGAADAAGIAAYLGLKKQSGNTTSGAWYKNSTGWWYRYSDGSYPKSELVQISGKWYYFDAKGYMVTGWKRLDGNLYYFFPSGEMAINRWVEGTYYMKEDGLMAVSEWVDNDKYYVGADGKWVPNYYKEGWMKNSTGWWYRNSDGSYPVSTWKQVNGRWYYFDANGYMMTGWIKDNGKSYYLDPTSGAMATGWLTLNGSRYYFGTNGAMTTGWRNIDGNYYYFYSTGVMATSAWVDSGKYYVGEDGVWDPSAGAAAALNLTVTASSSGIKVSWDDLTSSGTTTYQVSRKTSLDDWVVLRSSTTGTSYSDIYVAAGTSYTYRVVPLNSSGNARTDIQTEQKTITAATTPNSRRINMKSDYKVIWDTLKAGGLTDAGVAGMMGNLYAESGLRPNNLQDVYNGSISDADYTAAVDDGTYTYTTKQKDDDGNYIVLTMPEAFEKDSRGYGLAQWTVSNRKTNLYEYAKKTEASIGDLKMQLDFLLLELTPGGTSDSSYFRPVWNIVSTTSSVQSASNIVLTRFEAPADQGVTMQLMRSCFAQQFYNAYH